MVGERIFFGRKTNVSVTNEYLYLRFCDSTIVDKRMDSEIIVWYNLYSCHSFGKNNFFVDYVC